MVLSMSLRFILCCNVRSRFSKHKLVQIFLAKPVPKELIERNKKACFLQNQFYSDTTTDEEWFELVKELDNDEVIIGIIEHRLGWRNGCVNKKIWNFYYDFIKDKNPVVCMFGGASKNNVFLGPFKFLSKIHALLC